MSELEPITSLQLAEYQAFVADTRRPDDYDGAWRDAYSQFIAGEQLELLTQHGAGALLLLPAGFGLPNIQPSDTMRFRMADETGDLLWFGFDIADRLGLSAADICSKGLESFEDREQTPIATFAELEDRTLRTAQKIKVINKIGLLFPDTIAAEHHHTTLADDPNYLFVRTTHRLRRSLDEGKHDMMPPTASELEPIHATPESLALYLLTLTYIARNRLGISIDDVARFNMAKLTHRAQFGKANDLQFDDSFVRP